jgi:hypothetical protein
VADNVQFQSNQLATPASGTTVSTDEAASGHIQRVKIAYSADGVDTHVPADADGLRVNNGAHLDAVSLPMNLTDEGHATKSAIFGYSTAQGGLFEPVKVNPSGSLLVQASQEGGWDLNNISGTISLPTGAATEYSLGMLGSNLAAVKSGSNLNVAATTSMRQVRLVAFPTVSTTPAYTAKDAVGGKLTFANAARSTGGSITIQSVIVADKSQQQPSLELVLFDRDFTASSDNAAFDPADTDLTYIVGVIPVSNWFDFNDNSVATRHGLQVAAKLEGTDLYGQLVTRSTPTFVSTTDITVALDIIQD